MTSSKAVLARCLNKKKGKVAKQHKWIWLAEELEVDAVASPNTVLKYGDRYNKKNHQWRFNNLKVQ